MQIDPRGASCLLLCKMEVFMTSRSRLNWGMLGGFVSGSSSTAVNEICDLVSRVSRNVQVNSRNYLPNHPLSAGSARWQLNISRRHNEFRVAERVARVVLQRFIVCRRCFCHFAISFFFSLSNIIFYFFLLYFPDRLSRLSWFSLITCTTTQTQSRTGNQSNIESTT